MRFNLWIDDECIAKNVDVGDLLCWLGYLKFDDDVVVDVTIEEAAS